MFLGVGLVASGLSKLWNACHFKTSTVVFDKVLVHTPLNVVFACALNWSYAIPGIARQLIMMMHDVDENNYYAKCNGHEKNICACVHIRMFS
jgi:hypothetical protein